MNKKTGKIARIGPEVTDAELVTAPTIADTVRETLQTVATGTPSTPKEDIATKQVRFEKIKEDLLKQHQEKGSLAFELLKSVLAQNTSELMRGGDFTTLIKNVYALTDQFKKEVDVRWNAELQTATNQVFGTNAPDGAVN